jgi:septum formation protein
MNGRQPHSHANLGRHGTVPRIVLASASPRRRELLLQIGVHADVVPADIDENAIRHDNPRTLALELARAKARETARRLGVEIAAETANRHDDEPGGSETARPILAADTVVSVNGEILEKPVDREDAKRMLELISGRRHRVITGVAVIVPDGTTISHAAESEVTFSSLSGAEIEQYLQTDEWVGVAGAYRIQGHAARYVTHLSGSYSNVVGLPLHLVYSILTQYA